jgi:hypothetical protein
MSMDARVKDRVEEFLASLDRSPVARHVLGVVVAGSAARGEEVWQGERLLSDIDLMVLTRRTSPRLIARVGQLIARHRDRGIDGGPVPLGPLARHLTLAFYEARANGVMVRGPLDLDRLIPATAPADLPVWEGVRVLANRLVEHVKYDEGLISAERAVAKSYESLAEAMLVLERRCRPSYAERLAEIEREAPAAPREVVDRMLAVLRARVHQRAPAPEDVTAAQVRLARGHLLDGFATVASRHTGVSGEAADQLRVLAGRERHWRHRLYWAAVQLRRRHRVDVSTDPVIGVWRRTLDLLERGSTPAERRALLGDWRGCPQILVGRTPT